MYTGAHGLVLSHSAEKRAVPALAGLKRLGGNKVPACRLLGSVTIRVNSMVAHWHAGCGWLHRSLAAGLECSVGVPRKRTKVHKCALTDQQGANVQHFNSGVSAELVGLKGAQGRPRLPPLPLHVHACERRPRPHGLIRSFHRPARWARWVVMTGIEGARLMTTLLCGGC